MKKGPGDAEWTVSLTVTAFSIPQPQTRTQPIKNKTPKDGDVKADGDGKPDALRDTPAQGTPTDVVGNADTIDEKIVKKPD